jgi:hypothetical protein
MNYFEENSFVCTLVNWFAKKAGVPQLPAPFITLCDLTKIISKLLLAVSAQIRSLIKCKQNVIRRED